MQEHSVTAAGETMRLPEPFLVLATQNPIEQEGTYPLPEAQVDRFLFDIRVGYPSAEEEVGILRATIAVDTVVLAPVLDGAPKTSASRPRGSRRRSGAAVCGEARAGDAPRFALRNFTRQAVLRWGGRARAGQALILGAKAFALLNGRFAVSPADIRRVAHPVLRHRVLPNFAAEAEGVSVERIIDELLHAVQEPKSGIRV